MTKRLPLWKVMADTFDETATVACRDFGSMLARCKAAEIRALRDWLFPAGRPGDDSCCDVMQACLWDQLTTEADRAERGDG